MNEIKLGKTVKIRGFRGEIVIQTKYKNVELFRMVNNVICQGREYTVEEFKNLSTRIGLKLSGIDNEDKAREFIGKEIYVSKDELEFYEDIEIEDMMGFELVDETGYSYGILEDVNDYGAGNILTVMKEGNEFLFPQEKGFITGYDTKEMKIFVDSVLIGEVML